MILTVEIMSAIYAKSCHYCCGECSYDETDLWAAHQEHYLNHGEAQ